MDWLVALALCLLFVSLLFTEFFLERIKLFAYLIKIEELFWLSLSGLVWNSLLFIRGVDFIKWILRIFVYFKWVLRRPCITYRSLRLQKWGYLGWIFVDWRIKRLEIDLWSNLLRFNLILIRRLLILWLFLILSGIELEWRWLPLILLL